MRVNPPEKRKVQQQQKQEKNILQIEKYFHEREIFSGQKSIFKREIVSKETSFQERKNLDGFFSREKQTVSREKRCSFKRVQYFPEIKIFSSGKNIFKREKNIAHLPASRQDNKGESNAASQHLQQ